ncbi:MAG: hypothetical protein ACKVX9_08955 [Blastocatellia bacterium]
MNLRWLNVAGLILALAGVIVLARGLIISRKQAMKIGVSRLAGESDEQNLLLPQVRDHMQESRRALIGTILMVVGFLLQIIRNWLEF